MSRDNKVVHIYSKATTIRPAIYLSKTTFKSFKKTYETHRWYRDNDAIYARYTCICGASAIVTCDEIYFYKPEGHDLECKVSKEEHLCHDLLT